MSLSRRGLLLLVVGLSALVAGASPALGQCASFIQQFDWSNPAEIDNGSALGSCMAADGDLLAVGAPTYGSQSVNTGAVFLYRQVGQLWTEEVRLLPSDLEQNERFGSAVSVLGDRVLVGARYDNDSAPAGGAAYVFAWNGQTWVQEAKLLAGDGANSDYFGYSVCLLGDAAFVGAINNDHLGDISGSVYVFEFEGGQWVGRGKLQPNGVDSFDRFGTSIAGDGDRVVVGASTADGFDVSCGAAFIFHRNLGGWTQEARLTDPLGGTSANFGWSVAIDGDSAVVGAFTDGQAQHDERGAAFVFERSANGWVLAQKLVAPDALNNTSFGWSVAIAGSTIAIGAPDNTIGGAYLFRRNTVGWSFAEKIGPGNQITSDRFGYSLLLRSGESEALLVGATDRGAIPETYTGRIEEFQLHSAPVVIDANPQDESVPPGGVASFSVVASGGLGPLAYQWRMNGQPLVDMGFPTTIAGSTTPNLSLSNIPAASGWLVDCIVTEPCGAAAVSSPAMLSVLPPSACPGDANGNRIVNFADVTEVLENWGGACP